MREELEALLALQEQDVRIRDLEEKFHRLQDHLKQLEATLAAEEASLEEERRKLEELRRLSRERAAEVDDLDVQIRKYEKQLEEGLLSFKEMEALREKVRHSRERMEALEEEAIELLDRLEAEEERMKARLEAYARWRERIEEERAEVERQLKQQGRKIEEERAKRQSLVKGVDAALLERYERLLAEYDDPVVPMRDGRCTSCNLRLSETTIERVREGLELVTCENCLRILYC